MNLTKRQTINCMNEPYVYVKRDNKLYKVSFNSNAGTFEALQVGTTQTIKATSTYYNLLKKCNLL